jgi:hypothetical protein
MSHKKTSSPANAIKDALWGVAAIDTESKRKVWLDGGEIPAGVNVLGQHVRVPTLLFASPEGIHNEFTQFETVTAYAELTPEELARGQVSQEATDALAHEIAPEIAEALGGYVKRWLGK